VWWQVGSSATLGTTTSLAGNVLALTSITLNTGVSAAGRVLARNGAVTLDSSNVTACSGGPSPPVPPPSSLDAVPALGRPALAALAIALAGLAFMALRKNV
jgi:hypothetical protein